MSPKPVASFEELRLRMQDEIGSEAIVIEHRSRRLVAHAKRINLDDPNSLDDVHMAARVLQLSIEKLLGYTITYRKFRGEA